MDTRPIAPLELCLSQYYPMFALIAIQLTTALVQRFYAFISSKDPFSAVWFYLAILFDLLQMDPGIHFCLQWTKHNSTHLHFPITCQIGSRPQESGLVSHHPDYLSPISEPSGGRFDRQDVVTSLSAGDVSSCSARLGLKWNLCGVSSPRSEPKRNNHVGYWYPILISQYSIFIT